MRIIYLSGIDGCGKTTQAKLLIEKLQQQDINAQYLWFRWEPSFRHVISVFRTAKQKKGPEKKQCIEQEDAKENDWLRFKRRILKNPLFRQVWLQYACGDYYYSYKRCFKKIKADVIVIDRFVNDFIIDQAVNLAIPPNATEVISENSFLKKFHFPDFKIIIDLPALEGYTRKGDGTPLQYLTTRGEYYKALQGNDTCHLDGLQSIDELEKQIKTWVFEKLEVEKQ